MALPEFSMRQLLEAGAHFGHQTHRWNPKMDRYIFGSRSNIHIIDLSQSIPLLHQALVKVREVAAAGGRVLFVGTKRQASDPVATAAKRCAQYYVNHRWLGGTLTNWRTVSGSIARLRELEGVLSGEGAGRSKKELLQLTRERDKLELSLGGIKDMGGIPDIMFVIDTNKEAIAILEARKLNIPVVAILDTNCDPDGITYPIPGNDDAARALQLYCDLIADAVLDGLAAGQAGSGVDLGAAVNPSEPALARALAPEPTPEAAVEAAPAVAPKLLRPSPKPPRKLLPKLPRKWLLKPLRNRPKADPPRASVLARLGRGGRRDPDMRPGYKPGRYSFEYGGPQARSLTV
jgi:small subunit ribosomal protein S2